VRNATGVTMKNVKARHIQKTMAGGKADEIERYKPLLSVRSSR
jgi:hypothetical protein